MTPVDALSPLVAALVALLVLVGAAFAMIGSIGLLRMRTFYERIHPPTMGTTFGVGFTVAASMALFSALESRPVVHEILIGVFAIVTTPATYLLLVRAAVHRDSSANAEQSNSVQADDISSQD